MRKKSHKNSFHLVGRKSQKIKTREKLLVKTIEMLKDGKSINIEYVAKEAKLSKATAYRYFSSKEVLIREASLHSKSKIPQELFLDIEASLEQRIEQLIKYHFELFMSNEEEFRLFLSTVTRDSVQNKKGYSRAGRRIILIKEALNPIRNQVSNDDFEKMVGSISLVLGIESITILKDLCKFDDKKILETWKWLIFKIVKH